MEIGLNDKQVAYLKQVCRVRINFLWPPFFVFGCILLFILVYQIYNIPNNTQGFGLPALRYAQAGILFFFIFPATCIAILLSAYCLKRIIPIEKDIKFRSGEQVDFKILRKAYFPITNECYFFFKEVEIPNIQIDHATFLLHDEGNYFYIYRALHSKIVFENYLRFDLV